jgi:hypothetical protein
MFQSLGQRAWYAYWCLPRDAKLQPPGYRELERAHKLTNARLQKLVTGQLKRPSYGELIKMAAALKCEPAWLESGAGEAPHAQYPIPPFPEPKKKKQSAAGLTESVKAAFERDAKKIERSAPARSRRASK